LSSQSAGDEFTVRTAAIMTKAVAAKQPFFIWHNPTRVAPAAGR
jgi:hypothetical protein